MPFASSVRPPVVVGAHGSDSTISSATAIPGTPVHGGWLFLQALSQNVRYTMDGTPPTSTVGFRLAAGELQPIPIGAGQVITVIEEAAGASVQWQWLSW